MQINASKYYEKETKIASEDWIVKVIVERDIKILEG